LTNLRSYNLEEWTGSRLGNWRTSWRWPTSFTSAGPRAAWASLAQPALSKAIQQLERRLGVTLFERTSRAVALTGAGRVLSREARVALEAVSAAALRTQRAGLGDPPRPPRGIAAVSFPVKRKTCGCYLTFSLPPNCPGPESAALTNL
jgi:hypothetical protein